MRHSPAISLRLRGGLDEIADAPALIRWYDDYVQFGPTYYHAAPVSPANCIYVEDLAFAVLFAGRPRASAARSLVDNPVEIGAVPTQALHTLSAEERTRVVDGVMALIALDRFASAVATKVLHKKRTQSVPVMDNKAVYATYLDRGWTPGPGRWPVRSMSVTSRERVSGALNAIADEVSDAANEDAWTALEERYDTLTRIELFDKVWWAYARLEGAEP